VLALGLGLAGSPLSAQTPTPAPPAKPLVTVLKAARMFDGRHDATTSDAVIVVEGSKITAAGSGLPVPAGATGIDLGESTLLPGFIDCHTHLTDQSGDNWLSDFFEDLRRPASEQALLAAGYAKKVLDAGFTTVRDVGSEKDIDVGLRN